MCRLLLFIVGICEVSTFVTAGGGFFFYIVRGCQVCRSLRFLCLDL